MMGATQPFISGAISKTINLPNEATIDQIKECYMLSWQLGLKANALYRDGSKMSQPLSTKSDKKEKEKEPESVAETIQQIAEHVMHDLGKLTISELLEEVNKRVQASPDTKLKRELSRIVERKTLPAKRRGYTKPFSFAPANTAMAH
jgi:ribonucleoside-diphosphate reductase alpha chain